MHDLFFKTMHCSRWLNDMVDVRSLQPCLQALPLVKGYFDKSVTRLARRPRTDCGME
jgi:hypothetical protein